MSISNLPLRPQKLYLIKYELFIHVLVTLNCLFSLAVTRLPEINT